MNSETQAATKVNQAWLDGLAQLYSTTTPFSMDALSHYYAGNAVFVDPVHQVQGITAMAQYFNRVYTNLSCCQFVFSEHAQSGNTVFIRWQMTFQHPRLKHGTPITVPGCSHLTLQDQRITYHRDYYDVGCLLYDHIPVLGAVTGWLRRKLVP